MTVFPNPNSGDFNVLSNFSGTLTLFDLRGKAHFMSAINKDEVLNIQQKLAKGTYMITLTNRLNIQQSTILVK